MKNENLSPDKKSHWRIFILGFLIWLIVALVLWEFVKNAPVKNLDTEDQPVFEIIPRATDGVPE